MNQSELKEWRKRVMLLNYAEYELEKRVKEGKINRIQKSKIRKMLSELWIKVWDYYPHSNPLTKQAFKDNF